MTVLRLLPFLLLALPGCESVRAAFPGGGDGSAPRAPVALPQSQAETEELVSAAGRSETLPEAPRTVEDFDTTTEAERAVATAAAAAPSETEERALGTTIATLGDPAEPGLWLATPLVAETGPGRLVYPESGESVLVELRPIGGPATAGSRISLPAIRLLGAPIAGLPEIEVYAR